MTTTQTSQRNTRTSTQGRRVEAAVHPETATLDYADGSTSVVDLLDRFDPDSRGVYVNSRVHKVEDLVVEQTNHPATATAEAFTTTTVIARTKQGSRVHFTLFGVTVEQLAEAIANASVEDA